MSRQHSGRLTIFQSCAIDDKRVGAAAFRVLATLGTYSDERGWCWPSQATIAKRLGISRQAVNTQIKLLEELGYIEVHHQFDKETKAQRSSRYRLTLDYELRDEFRRLPLPCEEDTPQCDVDTVQPDIAPPATSEVAPPATSEVAPLTTHVNDPKEREIDPKLVRFWVMTLDYATLPDKLAREVRTMEPHSWAAGVLTLQAPAYLARRRALAHELLQLLAPVAPVELREVRVVNGQ